MHPPWYNSYSSHYQEFECMRQEMEELLYQHRVDIIFAGHVKFPKFSRRNIDLIMLWLKVAFAVTEGTCIREDEPNLQLQVRPMWGCLHNNRRWWEHRESWRRLCRWPWEVSFPWRQRPRDGRIMPSKLYFWPCQRQVLLGQTTWLECLQREQLRPWNPRGIFIHKLYISKTWMLL